MFQIWNCYLTDCLFVCLFQLFAYCDTGFVVLSWYRHVSSVPAWSVPTAAGSSSCLRRHPAERVISGIVQCSRACQTSCWSEMFCLSVLERSPILDTSFGLELITVWLAVSM